jgi:tetratricopeptide (TPR) repeat protein
VKTYRGPAGGLAHLKQGAPDKSIEDYNAALRLNPQFAAALYGRAVAKHKAGDPEAAATDLASARAVNPAIAEELSPFGVE